MSTRAARLTRSLVAALATALLVATGAAAVDSDSDGVDDTLDNCPEIPNAAQTDSGGVGTSVPNGIGDACECGDINGDGLVQLNDATILQRALVGLGPGIAASGKCNVTGDRDPSSPDVQGVAADCDVDDLTVIKRALLGLAPGVSPVCAGTADSPTFEGIALVIASSDDSISAAWLPAQSSTSAPENILYQVHLSTAPDFVPTAATLVKSETGALQTLVGGLTAATTYHALVVAIDELGNPSIERDHHEVTTASHPVVLNPDVPLENANLLGVGVPTFADGNSLHFTEHPDATLPTVGGILFAATEDETYLRKVDGVSVVGGEVVVQTSPATLSEAIPQLSLSSSVQLFDPDEIDDGEPAAAAARSSPNPAGSTGRRMEWPGLLIVESKHAPRSHGVLQAASLEAEEDPGQPGPPGKVVYSNGGLDIFVELVWEPTFVTDLEWTLASGVERGEFSAKGVMKFSATARYVLPETGGDWGPVTFDLLAGLFPSRLEPLSWTMFYTLPGGVPVQQTITLSLKATLIAAAQAEFTAQAGTEATVSVEFGSRYNPATGQWEGFSENSFDTNLVANLVSMADGSAEISGSVRLIPTLTVEFYSTAAVDMSLEPVVGGVIAAKLDSERKCPNGIWLDEFSVDLDASCFVEINVDVLNETFTPLERSEVCTLPTLPVFGLPTVAVHEETAAVSDHFRSIQLRGTATDGANNPLQQGDVSWGVTEAPALITSDPEPPLELPGAAKLYKSTLKCQASNNPTATFSGYGFLGPVADQCASVDLTCGAGEFTVSLLGHTVPHDPSFVGPVDLGDGVAIRNGTLVYPEDELLPLFFSAFGFYTAGTLMAYSFTVGGHDWVVLAFTREGSLNQETGTGTLATGWWAWELWQEGEDSVECFASSFSADEVSQDFTYTLADGRWTANENLTFQCQRRSPGVGTIPLSDKTVAVEFELRITP